MRVGERLKSDMSDVGRRLGLAHPDHGVDSVWTEQFQIHPNIKGVHSGHQSRTGLKLRLRRANIPA